jgi:hypothetical protein
MEAPTNNLSILIGSVKRVLDLRIILGDSINNETVVLLNTLNKTLEYCVIQYNAGNTEYSEKIQIIEDIIFSLKYGCENICNYYKTLINEGGLLPGGATIIDFKASNVTIRVSTLDYRISQLQITI